MSLEALYDLRGTVLKGVVLAVHDTGQAQTVDVQTHDGVVRSGVEVAQIAGLALVPPAEGATALLLAVGGDPGNMMALPLLNPAARFGGQAPGEAALYGPDGSRVAVRSGGLIQVLAGGTVHVAVGGVALDVTPSGITAAGPAGSVLLEVTASGIAITGPVTITGDLAVTGNVTITGTLSVSGAIHGTADHALHVP